MKILFFILAFFALVIFITVRATDSGEINDDDYYYGDSIACDSVAADTVSAYWCDSAVADTAATDTTCW